MVYGVVLVLVLVRQKPSSDKIGTGFFIFIMTVGEMFNFSFLNAFAMDRAEKSNNHAEYMALFTMSFSVSHIFGHNLGMQLINAFGYEIAWYIMGGLLILSIIFFVWLKNIVRKEER